HAEPWSTHADDPAHPARDDLRQQPRGPPVRHRRRLGGGGSRQERRLLPPAPRPGRARPVAAPPGPRRSDRRRSQTGDRDGGRLPRRDAGVQPRLSRAAQVHDRLRQPRMARQARGLRLLRRHLGRAARRRAAAARLRRAAYGDDPRLRVLRPGARALPPGRVPAGRGRSLQGHGRAARPARLVGTRPARGAPGLGLRRDRRMRPMRQNELAGGEAVPAAAQPRAGARNATLLATSVLTIMSAATIAPALPAMQAHFAGTDQVALMTRLVLTIPALAIALVALPAGGIIDRWGRRPFLIGAIGLYGIAGMSGLVLDSLGAILAGRALLGV